MLPGTYQKTLEMTTYLQETFFSGQREGWVLPMVGSRVWQPGTILCSSQKWAPGRGHQGSPTPGNQAPLWGRTGWEPTSEGQGRALGSCRPALLQRHWGRGCETLGSWPWAGRGESRGVGRDRKAPHCPEGHDIFKLELSRVIPLDTMVLTLLIHQKVVKEHRELIAS